MHAAEPAMYDWISEAALARGGGACFACAPRGREALLPSGPASARDCRTAASRAGRPGRAAASLTGSRESMRVTATDRDASRLTPQRQQTDMRANLVAGLDIGSTKTCAVIAEVIAELVSAA